MDFVRTGPGTLATASCVAALMACASCDDRVRSLRDFDASGASLADGAFSIALGSGIEFEFGFTAPTNAIQEHVAGGAAAGDYDGDGDIDVFIVRGDIGPNLLYRNDGTGVFSEVAAAAGVAFTRSASTNYRHSGPTFADMDGDGDLDLFIGGILGDPCRLFANQGDGTFVDVTSGSGLDTMDAEHTLSAAFGDYDLDGDVDLFLSHWTGGRISAGDPDDTENLWRNDSDATRIRFTSVSVPANIASSMAIGGRDDSLTPTFARIDGDEYPDILVVADFGSSKVFLNNRYGTFRDATDDSPFIAATKSDMGSAVADFDNDGDLDWFISAALGKDPFLGGSYGVGNRFYVNDGGVFRNRSSSAGTVDGGWGWGACAADFNLDGHLDIYHTNGWFTVGQEDFTRDASRLFMARGDGAFREMSADYGIVDTEQGRGVVCADFDGDLDVDVLLLHRNRDSAATLFVNDIAINHALRVELLGAAPNTQAAGARVRVRVGETTQTRDLTLGSNFTSQDPVPQIFGLGAATRADAVEITWPDGTWERYLDVAAGQVRYAHPGRALDGM